MSSGLDITVYLVFALIGGIVGATISRAKHRYTGFWMAICFLVPPAVFILLLLPSVQRTASPARRRNSDDSDNLDDF